MRPSNPMYWIISALRLACEITMGTAAAAIIIPWIITGAFYRSAVDLFSRNR